jgi:hypothetical protein
LFDRHDVIDKAGGNGAVRHPAHRVMIELGLRQRQPAIFLDGAQAERAIAAGAGQYDANGVFPLILGQG